MAPSTTEAREKHGLIIKFGGKGRAFTKPWGKEKQVEAGPAGAHFHSPPPRSKVGRAGWAKTEGRTGPKRRGAYLLFCEG